MKLVRIWMACCIFALLATVQLSFGFVVDSYTTLTADDAAAGDQYGFCVNTDGKWLVVGAKFATVDGLQSGAVYVYKREWRQGDWQIVQKLVPENLNGISPAEFGESVAVSHNRILIGARSMPNDSGQNSGTAFLYVYRGKKTGWVLESEIKPSDGQSGDEFGRAVALGPKRLFVGARFAHNKAGTKTGAVYVYRKKNRTWVLEAKLTDPNGTDNDQFGRAISFDAKRYKYLVVGSRKASDLEGDQGKITVFKRERRGWTLSQEIEAFDGGTPDYFGQSVALSGDLLVVGARNSFDENKVGVGAAYIYRLSKLTGEWLFEQKLMPVEGKDNGQYGFSVDFDRLTGTSLAVGARRMDALIDGEDGDPVKIKKAGLVYLYTFDSDEQAWLLDDIVVPDVSAEDDEFGQSIAIDPFGGKWVVVGADQVKVSGEEKAGAAYMLRSADTKPLRFK